MLSAPATEQAVVRFRYDVEGLVGEVRLSRHDKACRVDPHDIAERWVMMRRE